MRPASGAEPAWPLVRMRTRPMLFLRRRRWPSPSLMPQRTARGSRSRVPGKWPSKWTWEGFGHCTSTGACAVECPAERAPLSYCYSSSATGPAGRPAPRPLCRIRPYTTRGGVSHTPPHSPSPIGLGEEGPPLNRKARSWKGPARTLSPAFSLPVAGKKKLPNGRAQ